MTKKRLTALTSMTVVFALSTAALTACSSTTNSAAPNANPSLATSQDGSTSDSQVYDPFYLIGSNYAANSTVTVTIYPNNQKTGAVFTKDYAVNGAGSLAAIVDFTTDVKPGGYDAYTTLKGSQLAKADFNFLGSRTSSIARVVTKGATGAFISPITVGGGLYIAQSRSGGQIYEWRLGNLPTNPSATPVVIEPQETSTPDIAANVKMEQIALDNKKQNIFISKKAQNGNVVGGNSVWTYGWKDGAQGAGTNLAGLPTYGGDGSQAWPGNNAQAATDYTYAAGHFPKPNGSTSPTKVAIGNGGGVAQASNGYLYFGSLQSGCLYKQNMSTAQTWAIYCIPSWGAGNQNQSIYSLDTDNAGNVYAIYQGSTDNNTIIIKIVPGGDGQTTDKLSAIQLSGFARSVGLAVANDGKRIFADGVPLKQYDTNNTNTILEVDNPVWGDIANPTQTTPLATTLPGAYNETWLTGMTLVDKGGNKGDRLYIADNANGFWIYYL